MAPETPPGPRVEVRDASKTYPDGTEALAPLDLVLESGRTTALVGPSGCGKKNKMK